jgi:hypothetical protein
VELRSSRELLVWLVELGGPSRPGSGAFKRGEYLLSLATAEGKMPQPPGRFADWLYELRDGGLIAFDDSDTPRDVNLIRGLVVTAAGREFADDVALPDLHTQSLVIALPGGSDDALVNDVG